MRVLGLDPAAAGTTGYGVVETDGRHCRLVQFGAERAPRVANGDACTQLQAIHALVTRLVKRYAPDVVALESVFAALNLRTALRLAEVRGVVLLAAAQCGVPVHSYSPREVKYSVTGYGHASKQQVQQMVRAQLGLAVALCHIYLCQARLRLRSATRRATEPTATGPSSRRRIPSAR